jgi:signal transduction histidine kinase
MSERTGRPHLHTFAGAVKGTGLFRQITAKSLQRAAAECLIAVLALTSLTAISYRLHVNLATAGLLYVIVVVLASRTAGFVASIVASVVAALCLADLAPPGHSFQVADPLDALAVVAFLMTAVVIASLVSNLRRMTEKALSSVNRALIDAEERERARIARDLHDDIGQRIALLAIRIDEISSDPPNPGIRVQTAIEELQTQIHELAVDIQGLAHALHLPKLEHLGLIATMRSFCHEFGRRHKVAIAFGSRDLPLIPPADVSLSLFRVLQEALHNSVKHSGAQQFAVELFAVSDAIHLLVRDGGLGFNVEAADKAKGLGLVSMHERIRLVNGELSIESQPGRGTTIHACVRIGDTSHAAKAAR